MIVSFELYNISNTFQFFINITLRKYLNDFCSDYLDDILIYSETREQHVKHVFKVLKKYQIVELYLNIDKCEFFVQEIKYSKLIIIIDDIKMNSKKMKIIVD